MSFVLLIVKSLAYVGLPSYLLYRASQSSPLTRYYLCNILYLCTVGFCSSVGFCSALPLYLLGRRYDVNFVFAHTLYAMFSRLSGLRIIVEGKEHLQARPCVFIGNHQSMVDLFLLGACVKIPVYIPRGSDQADSVLPMGTRVMPKKSLKYMPFFGQFLQAGGAVFVDRGNSAIAVQSLQVAGEEIKKHHTSIWVFPEGTRTSRPYHDMRLFKKGAFHLAVQAGLPIVPVVFENYWNIYHKGVFNAGTFKVRGVKGSSSVCVPLY
jgi:lysophosphatidate acyltransferase